MSGAKTLSGNQSSQGAQGAVPKSAPKSPPTNASSPDPAAAVASAPQTSSGGSSSTAATAASVATSAPTGKLAKIGHYGKKAGQGAYKLAQKTRLPWQRSAAGALAQLGGNALKGRALAAVVGLGPQAILLTAATAWVTSPGLRKWARSLWGDKAPALDAPPENPRTYWLPLTHDGNRDGHDGGDGDGKNRILGVDQLMSELNQASLNYDPRLSGGYKVWLPNPPEGENHTAVLSQTTESLGALATKSKTLASNIRSTVATIPEAGDSKTLAASIEALSPQMTSLNQLGSTVLPAVSNGIVSTGQSADQFYKGFRDVNTSIRSEINNTTSGIIPFARSGIHLDSQVDGLNELKGHIGDMQQSSTAIRDAVKDWTVEANTSTPPGTGDGPTTRGKTGPSGEKPPTENPPKIDQKGDGTPQIPPLDGLPSMPSMPSMPQGGMPSMGGMPQGGMPSMGGMPQGGMPQSGMPSDLGTPMNPKASDEDLFGDDKDKPDVAEAGLGDDPVGEEDGADGVAGSAAAGPGVGGNTSEDTPAVATGEPADSNVANIGDKDRTFDNPKLAQMASLLANPGEGGGTSVEQAATEAGFRVPPFGQDIGTPVDQNDIQPGDIVSGASDRGVYLGDGDVVTESGEVKKLTDVAQFVNPEDGIYRLADDGGPAPNTMTFDAGAQQSAESPTPPPVYGNNSGPGLAGDSQSAYQGTDPATTALGQ